mgnify:CR=1 FL=1
MRIDKGACMTYNDFGIRRKAALFSSYNGITCMQIHVNNRSEIKVNAQV